MTKAEMEAHRAQYYELIAKARAARQDGRYREAVELAMSSWEYVDGMMQYERKYDDKKFSSIEGIDLVLEYAPILFDAESLDKLEFLLKKQRRLGSIPVRRAHDDFLRRCAHLGERAA